MKRQITEQAATPDSNNRRAAERMVLNRSDWKLILACVGTAAIVLAGIVKIIDDQDLPYGLLLIGFGASVFANILHVRAR